MTPKRLDAPGVLQKLEAIERFVADLEAIGPVSGADLEADRVRRNVAERALIGLVDLAAAVNAHLVAAAGEPGPSTYRDSFAGLARMGAIGTDLAGSLERAAGLRNVLVHLYVEVDPSIVAAAVPRAVEDFGRYVRSVAAWVLDHGG